MEELDIENGKLNKTEQDINKKLSNKKDLIKFLHKTLIVVT